MEQDERRFCKRSYVKEHLHILDPAVVVIRVLKGGQLKSFLNVSSD